MNSLARYFLNPVFCFICLCLTIYLSAALYAISQLLTPVSTPSFPELQIVVLLVSAILTLLIFVLGWWFGRPLYLCLKQANEVANGKVPRAIEIQKLRRCGNLTKTVNQMVVAVQNLDHDRRLLTTAISHDLKTPLTRMRLNVEMSAQLDNQIRNELIADVDSMDHIISQCLEFFHSQLPESPQRVEINQLIQDAINRLPSDDVSNLTISLDTLQTITVCKRSLSLIVTNLIDNAYIFGGEQIQIKTKQCGTNVRFSVEDNGNGISEAMLASICEPFVQGSLARNEPGCGLGLAVVRRLVQLLNGNLTLTNKPGDGFIAEVTIPYAP